MSSIRTTVLAAALTLVAIPVYAGGFSIDLPRLEFPTTPDATRACVDVTVPSNQCSFASN